jgi:hypothetical protein
MRFLSKLALICNICFIITVIMQIGILMDAGKKTTVNSNGIVHLNPFVSTIVVLGMIVAVFVNLFFIILFVARYPRKKMNDIARWIVYFNMILLPAQIYYLFFT